MSFDQPNQRHTNMNNRKMHKMHDLPLGEIQQNRNGSRRTFNEESDKSLKESVEKYGVLVPILVRKLENGTTEPVTESRRIKASQAAGEKTIPAIFIAEDDDPEVLDLIENTQREDLTPLDRAAAVQRIKDIHGCRQAKLAEMLCITPSTLSQWISIVGMDPEVKKAISTCKTEPLSFSHLREISSANTKEEQLDLVNKIASGKIASTVREISKEVKKINQNGSDGNHAKGGEIPNSNPNNQQRILSIKKAFTRLEKLIKENDGAIRNGFLKEFKDRVKALLEIIEGTRKGSSDQVVA